MITCETVVFVDVVSIFALDASGSAVCCCVVWVISECAVPEMGVVSSRSSAGRLVEFVVSCVFRLVGVVSVTGNASQSVAGVFRWLNGLFIGSIPVAAHNKFLGRSGSDVLHSAVEFVLALVRGWDI